MPADYFSVMSLLLFSRRALPRCYDALDAAAMIFRFILMMPLMLSLLDFRQDFADVFFFLRRVAFHAAGQLPRFTRRLLLIFFFSRQRFAMPPCMPDAAAACILRHMMLRAIILRFLSFFSALMPLITAISLSFTRSR